MLGLKERFSWHTLPEAAQIVKRPEGQPKSTSQRKSKYIAQTEGPNAAGIKVVAAEFVEQNSKDESKPCESQARRECFGPIAETRCPLSLVLEGCSWPGM